MWNKISSYVVGVGCVSATLLLGIVVGGYGVWNHVRVSNLQANHDSVVAELNKLFPEIQKQLAALQPAKAPVAAPASTPVK